MSDLIVRPSMLYVASSFTESCFSFACQRQKSVACIALAALGTLSYVLYRYLTTKREDSLAGKIDSLLLTADPKENRKLLKLKTKIQEEKKIFGEENQAISLSPPYEPIKKIKFYQRLDELVRKGVIHSWVCFGHLSVYIKCKKEDTLLPYQSCELDALQNNRSGWRDQDLIVLEDTFRKENPLKEPEEAALQELETKKRESIQHVLLQLKARGKPGVCHLLNPDSNSTAALSFLKTHGVIHGFKETAYFGNSGEVFITAQDQEIETKIESLAFPQGYDVFIKREIQNAYRQRLTEGKLAAFTLQICITLDSGKLDALVRAEMISWRRLKAEEHAFKTPVLVRFSAKDPVEQGEEAFDHTEYPHMKAGWRTPELLEHEETLRSVNKIIINTEALSNFFRGYSDDEQRKCEVLLFRLNKRVQTGPYLLKNLDIVEQLFLKFLQKNKAIFKIEWLNTVQTEGKVFVHAFDDNEETPSSL